MIVVYGSINIDVIGHAPTLMRPGETVLGTTLEFAPGGKGANQALAASRAGGEVRMVGCVGNDHFGNQALALLSEEEIDLSYVRRMDRHTGTALIIVDDTGENMITVLPGANARLNCTILEQSELGPEDYLLLQLEVPLPGIEAAIKLARERGTKTVLNLAPFMVFPAELLESIDVLVVNETELAGLLAQVGQAGLSEEDGLKWLADEYDLTVVATLGGRGAIAIENGQSVAVPALKIKPVDTVGAGDTFVGYLAVALSEGKSLKQALALASTGAGLACLAPGAQPSIPYRDAVEQRLNG
ncbi:ribokinase [Pelagibacterium lentulum]|uniref:Ribokinase n=1 Tax=Pelagibacterium lentulum TaxID=2029865 RepID=A0A916VVL0_9HYPH|nr:ribokinase [Pelagibacterium lentulum]GGA41313.1 ribokinase [Pelagibacterium lentulum]